MLATRINHIELVGSISRPPQLTITRSGQTLCDFSLRVLTPTRRLTKEVLYVDIEVTGRLADAAATHLCAGARVCVEGEMRFQPRARSGGCIAVTAKRLQLTEKS